MVDVEQAKLAETGFLQLVQHLLADLVAGLGVDLAGVLVDDVLRGNGAEQVIAFAGALVDGDHDRGHQLAALLRFSDGLSLAAQVRFALLARPGAQLADLRRVGTHAVAAAQCREWIATHLGGVDIVPEASNAAAAQGVAQGHYDAAIAPAVAAEVVGRDHVDIAVPPVMGAEDFSFMLEARPGAFIFVGNGDSAGLHHPAYDFNDELIPVGTSYWVKLVETALRA